MFFIIKEVKINILDFSQRTVNVKLSNIQLDKLKFTAKYVTDINLRLSSGMIGTGKANFPYNL